VSSFDTVAHSDSDLEKSKEKSGVALDTEANKNNSLFKMYSGWDIKDCNRWRNSLQRDFTINRWSFWKYLLVPKGTIVCFDCINHTHLLVVLNLGAVCSIILLILQFMTTLMEWKTWRILRWLTELTFSGYIYISYVINHSSLIQMQLRTLVPAHLSFKEDCGMLINCPHGIVSRHSTLCSLKF